MARGRLQVDIEVSRFLSKTHKTKGVYTYIYIYINTYIYILYTCQILDLTPPTQYAGSSPPGRDELHF